jgi:hypothetical protein
MAKQERAGEVQRAVEDEREARLERLRGGGMVAFYRHKLDEIEQQRTWIAGSAQSSE